MEVPVAREQTAEELEELVAPVHLRVLLQIRLRTTVVLVVPEMTNKVVVAVAERDLRVPEPLARIRRPELAARAMAVTVALGEIEAPEPLAQITAVVVVALVILVDLVATVRRDMLQ